MKVQVLGTGCMKCNKLYSEVEKAVAEIGMSVELSKIEKIEEIMKYGIAFTPALVVNGKVMIAGSLPKYDQIVTWLKEAAEVK